MEAAKDGTAVVGYTHMRLVRSTDLPPGAKFVAYTLVTFANREGVTTVSLEAICEATGYCPKTVRRHLGALEEANLISRRRRRRLPSEWRLTQPDKSSTSQDPEVEESSPQEVEVLSSSPPHPPSKEEKPKEKQERESTSRDPEIARERPPSSEEMAASLQDPLPEHPPTPKQAFVLPEGRQPTREVTGDKLREVLGREGIDAPLPWCVWAAHWCKGAEFRAALNQRPANWFKFRDALFAVVNPPPTANGLQIETGYGSFGREGLQSVPIEETNRRAMEFLREKYYDTLYRDECELQGIEPLPPLEEVAA